MNRLLPLMLVTGFTMLVSACGNANNIKTPEAVVDLDQNDTLPAPFATKSTTNNSKVIGWEDGQTPTAPAGFTVTRFSDSLDHPRWVYVADNGDVFVAESNTVLKGLKKFGAKISRKLKTQKLGESAGRITMLRDTDKDGKYESRFVFAEGFNQPLGMLIVKNYFYVAGTDGVWRYNYTPGMTQLNDADEGKMIVELPAGGYNNHWTRNIITNKAQDKLYISVGSGSNVAEHGMENEIRRACILETNLDGTGERVYGSGLRNPVGMDWAPGTNTLWTAVNERDGLGDDLVPDYITSVKPGGFYGWPYSYFGQHPDPRMKDDPKPELVKTAIVPDVAVGSHTASLGIAFNTGKSFPAKYTNGAFVGQHGSWNRSTLAGYKVIFVPFNDGKAAGKPEDFLTGFIADAGKSEVHGRPVCTAFLADGSLLVTDDVSNVIWRVSATSK
jgi:glucose/arabinose dehydrogenase